MFTGIIEEVGVIRNIRNGANSKVLSIEASTVLGDTKIGDSIAVNGVCLTVTDMDMSGFTADVMHETINRSSLGSLDRGGRVNMERALALGDRLGGHIVSGHIDGTGTIAKITKDDNAIWFEIKTDEAVLRYIVEKGSITIDGISLTVAAVTNQTFSVSTIPHTLSVTTLGDRKIGDTVNLENDLIGKYVEKLITIPSDNKNNKKESKITSAFLMENGF